MSDYFPEYETSRTSAAFRAATGIMPASGWMVDMWKAGNDARDAFANEVAAQLDRDAAVLWPPGKRTNSVDRHTADLFRAKAQWIRNFAEAK